MIRSILLKPIKNTNNLSKFVSNYNKSLNYYTKSIDQLKEINKYNFKHVEFIEIKINNPSSASKYFDDSLYETVIHMKKNDTKIIKRFFNNDMDELKKELNDFMNEIKP